jgi:hypothetical protein
MAFYENLSFADMAKGEGGGTVEREEELTYTEQVYMYIYMDQFQSSDSSRRPTELVQHLRLWGSSHRRKSAA